MMLKKSPQVSQPTCVCYMRSSFYRFLEKEGFKDGSLIYKIISKSHLTKINDDIFKDHPCIANNIHRPAEILTKMDAMNFALKHHDNTFFLDADIIILDNLQEYFTCKVILSPHYYPKSLIYNGFENGFYNAGYVFALQKVFLIIGNTFI